MAIDEERVIGTCRLAVPRARGAPGRLAVEPGQRGQGVAAAILHEADRVSEATGADRISLHAQTYALDLYVNGGYRERGRRFMEEGIEHVAMEKRLA